MGPQFFETPYGRRFFDVQLPNLIKAINRLAEAKGAKLPEQNFAGRKSFKEREYDRLADMIRENMDMEAVYGMLREARYEL